MRLFWRNAFLLLLSAGTIACHNAASAAQADSRDYVLESINGHTLPAVWYASTGDTGWTHSGKLSLYPDGKAIRVAYQTHTYHGTPAGGGTSTWRYPYRIRGDTIEFGFRACKAPCFMGDIGRFSDSVVTLTGRSSPPIAWPVYKYRLSHAR
jgi:hypothetical protein